MAYAYRQLRQPMPSMERLREIEADVRRKRGLLPSTPTASVPATPRPAEASPRYIEQLERERSEIKKQWDTLAHDCTLAELEPNPAKASALRAQMKERESRMEEIAQEVDRFELSQRVAKLLACGKPPLQLLREKARAREWKKVSDLLQYSGDPEAQELVPECRRMAGQSLFSTIVAPDHQALEQAVLDWSDHAEAQGEGE